MAFDAARQHSRRVRFLKIAVPSVAALGVAAFLGYSLYPSAPAATAEAKVTGPTVSGGKITMAAPHMTGFNKQQQAYDVTAHSATQTTSAPGLIDLAKIKAVILMTDKSSSTLHAHTGKFDSGKEILNLAEAVKVESTKGYSADLSTATVDFKSGIVNSQTPVTINLSNGKIHGGTMAIASGGGIITLSGGVSSRFQRPLTATPGTGNTPTVVAQ